MGSSRCSARATPWCRTGRGTAGGTGEPSQPSWRCSSSGPTAPARERARWPSYPGAENLSSRAAPAIADTAKSVTPVGVQLVKYALRLLNGAGWPTPVARRSDHFVSGAVTRSCHVLSSFAGWPDRRYQPARSRCGGLSSGRHNSGRLAGTGNTPAASPSRLDLGARTL